MSEVDDDVGTVLDHSLRSMLELPEEDDKNFVYCATCSHVITTLGEKISVNGSHTHHFTNPHGFEFDVGCFGNALGCTISGGPEAADSWFFGFVWRVATCAECISHLGWYFSSSDGQNNFYGLILDRIQEEAENSN